jgi:hypothetical protein
LATYPYGIAFDGANIWVANINSNNVTKRVASTGALVGTYPVGTGPSSVAFDGANIWVGNSSGNSVTKLMASTGALVGTYPVGSPYSIAFDGVNIWVANNATDNVTKLMASTGAVIGTYPGGSSGIAKRARLRGVNRPGFARARGDARRPLRGQKTRTSNGFQPVRCSSQKAVPADLAWSRDRPTDGPETSGG